MFSKSRINEPGPKAETETTKAPEALMTKPAMDFTPSSSKGKATASILSSDLTVVGNLRTTGDIQVEGTVEGDIRAHLLTVGESATIRGEIVADDIVVNGRVIGRVRGLKVRLTSTARVEGAHRRQRGATQRLCRQVQPSGLADAAPQALAKVVLRQVAELAVFEGDLLSGDRLVGRAVTARPIL